MIETPLSTSLARLETHFRNDSRCHAMYLWGSLGTGSADTYSDVDVAAIVNDEDYPAVRAELPALCERLCGPLLAWLPEGETPHYGNFAFLFEAEGRVWLYDFYLSGTSTALQGPGRAPKQILFDPRDLLKSESAASAPTRQAGSGLGQSITNYWVYMYLNGKYFRRRDIYKMLYVQDVLFRTHLDVLSAFYPEPGVWWARDVQRLPDAKREELLVYFGSATLEAVAAAVEQEMDLFSEDAQAACQQAGAVYPQDLEAGVRRHLRHMGVV